MKRMSSFSAMKGSDALFPNDWEDMFDRYIRIMRIVLCYVVHNSFDKCNFSLKLCGLDFQDYGLVCFLYVFCVCIR